MLSRRLFITIGCLMAVSILTSCGSADPRAQASSSNSQSPDAPCDLEEANEALYGDKDTPVVEGSEELLCEKAAQLIADEKADQEADPDSGEVVPAPEPSPDYYEEGIFGEEETKEGPTGEFEYTTLWRGVIEEENVAVFAGSLKKDSSAGAVWLWIVDPFTYVRTDEAHIEAPIPGPLRITDASNPLIHMVSESTGEKATFNAQTRKWE